MSSITAPSAEVIKTCFEAKHVTIEFSTENRGRYTLVSRPTVVVLIKDSTGQAWRGTRIQTSGHRIQLLDEKGLVWKTTPVTSFFVATN